MPIAESSIEIDAPISIVWEVMLDFPRYGEWNPFLHRIDADGPARVGNRLRLYVRWPSGGGAQSGELVTRVDPPSEEPAVLEYVFTGLLDRIGAVRATRVQSLTRVSSERTTYFTREVFSGWLTWALPLAKVQAGFAAHAQAIRARSETLAAERRVKAGA